MPKYLIDTNFLARILIKDNTQQLEQIMDLIDKVVDQNLELFVDTVVIFELVYFLTGKIYQLSRLETVNKINALLDLNCFTFENTNLITQSLTLYQTSNLDIVDCYLIQKAIFQKYQFQSFDQKALKIYQKLKDQSKS